MLYFTNFSLTSLCVFLEFELRALLSKHSTSWAIFPDLFDLGIFQIKSHFLPRGSLGPWSSYLYIPSSWYYSCALMPHLFVEMGVSLAFCSGWPQTTIVPISASQKTRISAVIPDSLTSSLTFRLNVLKIKLLNDQEKNVFHHSYKINWNISTETKTKKAKTLHSHSWKGKVSAGTLWFSQK
jgi:hypothetical protein